MTEPTDASDDWAMKVCEQELVIIRERIRNLQIEEATILRVVEAAKLRGLVEDTARKPRP